MSDGDRSPARWDRVVLKVSGEAFAGEAGYGISGEIVGRIAEEIVSVCAEFDVDIAVVVGGGSGMGEAIALGLAAEGATVVVAGRRLAKLNEVATQADGTILTHTVDVADRAT